jgi:hypothetical protein
MDADAAALRLLFNRVVDKYPQHLAQFLTRDGEQAFRQWWTALYEGVRDSQAGLKLLAEMQQLKDRVRELEQKLEGR